MKSLENVGSYTTSSEATTNQFYRKECDSDRQISAKTASLGCQDTCWKYWSGIELLDLPVCRINLILEELHAKVEEVSSQLVLLLQRRDELVEEVGIRNVVIEQLVKMQEKTRWRLMCAVPSRVLPTNAQLLT